MEWRQARIVGRSRGRGDEHTRVKCHILEFSSPRLIQQNKGITVSAKGDDDGIRNLTGNRHPSFSEITAEHRMGPQCLAQEEDEEQLTITSVLANTADDLLIGTPKIVMSEFKTREPFFHQTDKSWHS